MNYTWNKVVQNPKSKIVNKWLNGILMKILYQYIANCKYTPNTIQMITKLDEVLNDI
jgi:hypothetical protein